jgi:WhiB family redox-sensing transcriptional regulator
MSVNTLSNGVCRTSADESMQIEPVWAFEIRTPCRSHDPELWFAEDLVTVERAQSLCRVCPLQQECLSGAIVRREPWGVWGGEVFEQGQVVARKRRPGRPRKDAALTHAAAEAALAQRLHDAFEVPGAELHTCDAPQVSSIPAQRDGAAA